MKHDTMTTAGWTVVGIEDLHCFRGPRLPSKLTV